ncbi:steroid 17-alpha-hydroxylase/17,20 lyase-like [Ostrea edulis]|uniref:steroid 17-alpha-hydroxylase/17,20 lyase-like n=1 Tax=Ostrea edulis TaxID=37623 RepID=UPI0024AF3921|nr:steroid 17-alpha-hydroxylase/17,20 lyase-like [Ostrea edulis]
MGQRFIVLNSADAAREIFLKEPNATITAARPSTFFGTYLQDNYKDVFFASPNPKWTKRRKLVYQLLRTYGEGLVNIEIQIKRNLIGLTKEIRTLNGQCIDPGTTVEEFILNTIENLVIGKSTGRDSDMHRILKKFDHLSNDLAHVGMDLLYSSLPFLRFLPFRNSKKIKEWFKSKQQMIETFERQGQVCKNNFSLENKDFLSSTRSPHVVRFIFMYCHFNINISQFSKSLQIYFVIAYLTTRGTLLSLIQILAKRPELQKSMQNEIENVIGSIRQPALEDKQHCPLVEAVTLEILRYISHGAISAHCASQATEIFGVPVDRNTPILVNFWAMHHSTTAWQEPFSFRPERFLDKDGGLLPPTDPVRKRLLVFGIGKRSCVGEIFAKSRIFLFLATVLQNFTIMEPDDGCLPDLLPREMESSGIILQPKPYKVRFVLREK